MGRIRSLALAASVLFLPTALLQSHALGQAAASHAAVTSADDPTIVVQRLNELWGQEQVLASQLTEANRLLDALVARIAKRGARVPLHLRTQLVTQRVQFRVLQARRDDVSAQIDQAKAALSERATQESAARAAQRAAEEQADPRLAQLNAVIATIPYPVRTLGSRVVFGHHPDVGPAWGVYDRDTNHIYVGDSAFATDERFRYTVTHEFAHAYEEVALGDADREQAFAIVRGASASASADELFADCLATLWGAGAGSHYWSCPDEVAAQLASLVR